MVLATTVIGAWPKPSYLSIPDWFVTDDGKAVTNMAGGYDPRETCRAKESIKGEELERSVKKAVEDVLDQQVASCFIASKAGSHK